MIAAAARDGCFILSNRQIKKKKGSYFTDGSSIDDIIEKSGYVVRHGVLYRSGNGLEKVPETYDTLIDALVDNYSHHNYILMVKDGTEKNIKAPGALKKSGRWTQRKKRKQFEKILLSQLEKDICSRLVSGAGVLLKRWTRKDVISSLDRRFYEKNDRELIIGVKDFEPLHEVASYISSKLGVDYTAFRNIPYAVVRCDPEEAEKLASACKNILKKGLRKYLSDVQASEAFHTPELILAASGYALPDIGYRYNWNLTNIGIPAAWNISKGNGATVMVVDTGIDFHHPDLISRFSSDKGWSFDGDIPIDRNGHGTHVAGIIAGKSTGVAPGSGLYAAKALNDEGSGSNTNVIFALDHAISRGDIDVINMSLGSRANSYALKRACHAAYQKGIILVAAAGNSGFGAEYPAAYDSVISVAAVDPANRHARFSNIHKTVEISAPGVGIMSTYLDHGYRQLTGTSMASPHCSAVAALSVASDKRLSPGHYRRKLASSAMPVGKEERKRKEKYGAGVIQADALLSSMKKNYLRRLFT